MDLDSQASATATHPEIGDLSVESMTLTDENLLRIPEADVPLEDEVDRLAQALSLKFEELTLIHQFSERLKIGEDTTEICQNLLLQLEPCLHASTIAIDLFEDAEINHPRSFLLTGETDAEKASEIAVQTMNSVCDGEIILG